ncbi:MAG TPA: hypothetical protein VKX28_33550 [Xanthobacteraceae bacterium]|nr:hypothetical protein [Xanthobacteraceae bacterium]
MHQLIYEDDALRSFLLFTILLGGGAAWLAGRAIAQTWRPWWSAVAYMLILGLAVRFFHYALFSGTLLSLHYYVVDTAILIGMATLGFRARRQAQMARQYGFLQTIAPPAAARQDAAP